MTLVPPGSDGSPGLTDARDTLSGSVSDAQGRWLSRQTTEIQPPAQSNLPPAPLPRAAPLCSIYPVPGGSTSSGWMASRLHARSNPARIHITPAQREPSQAPETLPGRGGRRRLPAPGPFCHRIRQYAQGWSRGLAGGRGRRRSHGPGCGLSTGGKSGKRGRQPSGPFASAGPGPSTQRPGLKGC